MSKRELGAFKYDLELQVKLSGIVWTQHALVPKFNTQHARGAGIEERKEGEGREKGEKEGGK